MQPTKKMPDGIVVHSVLPPPVLKEVEAIRGARSPIPPRASVLRELVELGLATIKSQQLGKGRRGDAALADERTSTQPRRRAPKRATAATETTTDSVA